MAVWLRIASWFLIIIYPVIALPNDDGCNIWSNRFTVQDGEFKDICGSITLTARLGDLYSTDDIFHIENQEKLTMSEVVAFDNDQWAIFIEGKRSSDSLSFDIILGPLGGTNCQIRFDSNNRLFIASNYPNSGGNVYYQNYVTLPDDYDELNTILLYYENGNLQIYQNDNYVTTITETFDIGLGAIGGWYSSYYSNIGIKNIMFSFDTPHYLILQPGYKGHLNQHHLQIQIRLNSQQNQYA